MEITLWVPNQPIAFCAATLHKSPLEVPGQKISSEFLNPIDSNPIYQPITLLKPCCNGVLPFVAYLFSTWLMFTEREVVLLFVEKCGLSSLKTRYLKFIFLHFLKSCVCMCVCNFTLFWLIIMIICTSCMDVELPRIPALHSCSFKVLRSNWYTVVDFIYVKRSCYIGRWW